MTQVDEGIGTELASIASTASVPDHKCDLENWRARRDEEKKALEAFSQRLFIPEFLSQSVQVIMVFVEALYQPTKIIDGKIAWVAFGVCLFELLMNVVLDALSVKRGRPPKGDAPPVHLNPQQKLALRRERNAEAATRYRNNQKQLINELQQEIDALKQIPGSSGQQSMQNLAPPRNELLCRSISMPSYNENNKLKRSVPANLTLLPSPRRKLSRRLSSDLGFHFSPAKTPSDLLTPHTLASQLKQHVSSGWTPFIEITHANGERQFFDNFH
ncbi:unnamed protein product, partial [Mesorhabditis spiculigera]